MPIALGLMSGTSCDGVSAAVVQFGRRSFQLLAYRTFAYPSPIPRLLHRAQELTTADLAQMNVLLGELFALAALRLIRASRVSPHRITVIGSHGQTVYHGPTDPIPCTLQLGEPAVIAHRTGLPVAANFRPRDLAAGGQGAPLIPFFDDYFFGSGSPRALQNIGGIANVTLIGRRLTPLAFDTGPGNCLIDAVARRISRGAHPYDRAGRLAANGRLDQPALKRLLAHPYFRLAPPKSTGPETFNTTLLDDAFGPRWPRRPHDTLATVTYATAHTIAESYRRFFPVQPREVIVSGGGCFNRTLMIHLQRLLDPIPVHTIVRYGLPPQAKEPAAFAFLGLRVAQRRLNHLPMTTGATEPCILGSMTPA